MATADALILELPRPPKVAPWRAPLRRILSSLLILVVLCTAWEGYKLVGALTEGKLPLTDLNLPIRADDKSMPHVWTIVGTLFEPARRGGEDTLLVLLARAALFTWQEAGVGFILGGLIGFTLALVFARFALLERSLMPYVVASQTIPLLAIAPMIVIWGGRLDWPAWWAVSLISAYLTFFPVTINTLRGLRSPSATSVELMRSFAASDAQVLWKLRLPAALPYIFTALKVSATASVIGAIVGELPSGIQEGLGRILLTFSYYFISGPEKLFASILGAAALGITFAAIIAGAERLVLPPNRRLTE